MASGKSLVKEAVRTYKVSYMIDGSPLKYERPRERKSKKMRRREKLAINEAIREDVMKKAMK